MTYFIGLGHYSRTGKDTFANALISSFKMLGITASKKPFAWRLKQVAYELYGWDGLMPPEYYDTTDGEKTRQTKLPTLNLTPVEIWVKLGTDAVRKNVYDKTWIDCVMRGKHEEQVVIIPDVRFYNEVDAIREQNGLLIKVIRPGFDPITEVDRVLLDYEGWDHIIGHSGKIEELQKFAVNLTEDVKGCHTSKMKTERSMMK